MRILKYPSLIFAVLLVAAAWALVLLAGVAHAATTSPDLTITKQACAAHVNPGDSICYQIVVENSGSADSSQVHVEDDLPGAVLWRVTADTLGCSLATNPDPGNHQALICDVEGIAQRHLNASGSDFENGVAVVQVDGIAGPCGEQYVNYGASLDDARDDIHLVSGSATITVDGPDCATPTPTATPTSPPTETPTTPTATSTPVVIVIHDTPTPGAVITPRPPNTGTGVVAIAPKGQSPELFGFSAAAAALGLSMLVGTAYLIRRRR